MSARAGSDASLGIQPAHKAHQQEVSRGPTGRASEPALALASSIRSSERQAFWPLRCFSLFFLLFFLYLFLPNKYQLISINSYN
jgi:hypothetical protein